MVVQGEWDKERTRRWLKDFQSEVDKVVGGDYFKFTACVWIPINNKNGEEIDGVSIITDNNLPYLDMKMSWDIRGQLKI